MRLSIRVSAIWLIGIATLTGCTREPVVEKVPPTEPVVVYAAYADKTYLPTLLTEFTAQTGQIVVVRNGQVPGIVDDVIGNRVSPPADILLTPSVYGVWRTAEEGELRPHYSTVVDANAPPWLRDPDKFWVAVSYRNAVLVYDSAQIAATDLTSYEDLAAAQFRRKLCLSTSSLSINRSVIAMLIRKLGKRETELAVRSWVANLAQPAFDSEEQLLLAVESGDCALAMMSSNVAGSASSSNLRVFTPVEAYADAEAIGITRHARNPEGAAKLIDWLLQENIQEQHAKRMSVFPVTRDARSEHAVVQAATTNAEAAALAERARYR